MTLRICPYPGPKSENRYLELYYRALEPHGFTLGPTLELSDGFLRARAAEFDLIHIQWLHERIWRVRGGGLVARMRGVAGLWRFLRLAQRLGKKIVWTVHDLQPHDGGGLADRAGTTLLGQMADLVICHSAATRDRFVRQYWGNPRKVVIMRHGNYDGVYPPARPRGETLAELGLDPRKKTLVVTGMVRAYKGLDVAVDAARRLGPDYQLIIAGNKYPPEPGVFPDLEARAAGLDHVRLVGRSLSDADLADLNGAADCVVLPYRRITGSGVLAAAFTLGRGVVASDLPYFRSELADEPAAGVLVRPDDPDALADGIRAFFASDVPARHAAARRIADRLAWSDVVKPVAERLHALFPETRNRAPRLVPVGGAS